MCQQVFEIVSEVRKEGVDSMIELKKKFGSTTDDKGLKEHLSTVRSVMCSFLKVEIMDLNQVPGFKTQSELRGQAVHWASSSGSDRLSACLC